MKRLFLRALKILFIIIVVSTACLFCKTFIEFRKDPSLWILNTLIEYDTEYLNDSKYTLTVVTTGFADKIDFVKLYKGEIKYDKHGNPMYDNVIFGDFIDLDPEESEIIKNIESGDLDLKNRKIVIKLSTKEEQIFDISEVQEVR